ncbi:MAG: hypothetical protein IJ087_01040 [Eggerthellaceae bacterium]|nr:hypothetical protein [Eggerthellaceae bacterium]
MTDQKQTMLNWALPSAADLDLVKTIILFEAKQRGLTRGQAFLQLIMESADMEKYPEELRARFKELEEHRRNRATRNCLDVTEMGKVS